jgi:hypothetical protein
MIATVFFMRIPADASLTSPSWLQPGCLNSSENPKTYYPAEVSAFWQRCSAMIHLAAKPGCAGARSPHDTKSRSRASRDRVAAPGNPAPIRKT